MFLIDWGMSFLKSIAFNIIIPRLNPNYKTQISNQARSLKSKKSYFSYLGFGFDLKQFRFWNLDF